MLQSEEGGPRQHRPSLGNYMTALAKDLGSQPLDTFLADEFEEWRKTFISNLQVIAEGVVRLEKEKQQYEEDIQQLLQRLNPSESKETPTEASSLQLELQEANGTIEKLREEIEQLRNDNLSLAKYAMSTRYRNKKLVERNKKLIDYAKSTMEADIASMTLTNTPNKRMKELRRQAASVLNSSIDASVPSPSALQAHSSLASSPVPGLGPRSLAAAMEASLHNESDTKTPESGRKLRQRDTRGLSSISTPNGEASPSPHGSNRKGKPKGPPPPSAVPLPSGVTLVLPAQMTVSSSSGIDGSSEPASSQPISLFPVSSAETRPGDDSAYSNLLQLIQSGDFVMTSSAGGEGIPTSVYALPIPYPYTITGPSTVSWSNVPFLFSTQGQAHMQVPDKPITSVPKPKKTSRGDKSDSDHGDNDEEAPPEDEAPNSGDSQRSASARTTPSRISPKPPPLVVGRSPPPPPPPRRPGQTPLKSSGAAGPSPSNRQLVDEMDVLIARSGQREPRSSRSPPFVPPAATDRDIPTPPRDPLIQEIRSPTSPASKRSQPPGELTEEEEEELQQLLSRLPPDPDASSSDEEDDTAERTKSLLSNTRDYTFSSAPADYLKKTARPSPSK